MRIYGISENLYLINSFKIDSSPFYPEIKEAQKGSLFYWIDGENFVFIFYPEKIKVFGEKDVMDLPLKPHIAINEEDIPREGYFSYSVYYIVPRIFIEDVNGDGKDDLIEAGEDSIYIFLRKEKSFENKPSLIVELPLKEKEEISSYFSEVIFKDVNKDGKADFIFSEFNTRAVLSGKSYVYFFTNKNGTFGKMPDQILVLNTFLPSIKLFDFNKDGYCDIMVNVSSLNLLSLLKMLITGKFEQKFAFYTFEKGVFSESPLYTYSVYYPINIRENEKGKSIATDFTGDFNSDGLPDMFLKEKDIVKIFVDRKDFGKKPFREVNAGKDFPEYLLKDINGDKKDDVILYGDKEIYLIIWH